LWRRTKTLHQRVFSRPVAEYVLVAGMQRSGTNLLMDILDANADTRVFHETDPRAFERYEMRDLAVIRRLAQHCPAPVFVIKALCELDRIKDLMDAFRPAKTVWVVRDWRDSVNSALKSFGNFVPQWNRLARGDASDWRGRGMSAATRELLDVVAGIALVHRRQASQIGQCQRTGLGSFIQSRSAQPVCVPRAVRQGTGQ